MIRKFLVFFLLLFLHNCASPSTALLGPVITGAKTGSVYQASLSYSSGRVINILEDSVKNKTLKEKRKIKNYDKTPQAPVLIAILIPAVEISEVIEPEPLP